MVITNNHDLFHLWWHENFVKHQNVSKYYDQDRSNDKICIRYGESLKENDPLNHAGARYQDNQNEKHPL